MVLTPQAAGTLTSLGTNVVVDPENLIYESFEDNNTAETVTTTVTINPDIELTPHQPVPLSILLIYTPTLQRFRCHLSVFRQ